MTRARRPEARARPLPADEVHVWVGLDVAHWQDLLTPAQLSVDELDRARRFPFQRERRRFVAARKSGAMLNGHVPPTSGVRIAAVG